MRICSLSHSAVTYTNFYKQIQKKLQESLSQGPENEKVGTLLAQLLLSLLLLKQSQGEEFLLSRWVFPSYLG